MVENILIAHITIKGVSEPKVSHAELGRIDVMLDTVEHGRVPCTLCPKDNAPYAIGGKIVTNAQLCELVASGLFGPVS